MQQCVRPSLRDSLHSHEPHTWEEERRGASEEGEGRHSLTMASPLPASPSSLSLWKEGKYMWHEENDNEEVHPASPDIIEERSGISSERGKQKEGRRKEEREACEEEAHSGEGRRRKEKPLLSLAYAVLPSYAFTFLFLLSTYDEEACGEGGGRKCFLCIYISHKCVCDYSTCCWRGALFSPIAACLLPLPPCSLPVSEAM